jgi:hypothetical protein
MMPAWLLFLGPVLFWFGLATGLWATRHNEEAGYSSGMADGLQAGAGADIARIVQAGDDVQFPDWDDATLAMLHDDGDTPPPIGLPGPDVPARSGEYHHPRHERLGTLAEEEQAARDWRLAEDFRMTWEPISQLWREAEEHLRRWEMATS